MRAWGGGGRAVTERPWFWSFGRPKSSILRSFCHSHAGLREGAGSDRKTLVLELWEANPMRAWGGAGSDRKTLVLELWEAQKLNSHIFCHSHAGLGGGGGAGSDRKTLVLELCKAQNLISQALLSLQLWEAQNLNSQVFLSLPCGPGGGGGQ